MLYDSFIERKATKITLIDNIGQFFYFLDFRFFRKKYWVGGGEKKKGNRLLHAFMVTVHLSWLFVWSAETTMSPSVCFFSALMNVFTTGEENWFK